VELEAAGEDDVTTALIAPLGLVEWCLLDRRTSEQAYLTRNWDFEVGQRLVIGNGQRIVEASVFRHSLRGQPVKTVVELPTSFGCQVRCPHCASGDIGMTRSLTTVDMECVYDMVSQGIEGPRLVAFSGIGECSLNEREVFAFVRAVAQRQPATFTLTTVGVRPAFVDAVDILARDVPVKRLQISLFHPQTETVRAFMGRAFALYDFDALMERVRATQQVHVRLNIVLMAGFNDSPDVWRGLGRALSGLEKNISVRISYLNETNVSRRNGIVPAPRERVLEAASWFVEHGFDAYPFMSSFNDDMNCGQLVWKYRASTSVPPTESRPDLLVCNER
jgi:adenine C2-methylase RlmN of 23S rRNA A2503 and tRNA A37